MCLVGSGNYANTSCRVLSQCGVELNKLCVVTYIILLIDDMSPLLTHCLGSSPKSSPESLILLIKMARRVVRKGIGVAWYVVRMWHLHCMYYRWSCYSMCTQQRASMRQYCHSTVWSSGILYAKSNQAQISVMLKQQFICGHVSYRLTHRTAGDGCVRHYRSRGLQKEKKNW